MSKEIEIKINSSSIMVLFLVAAIGLIAYNQFTIFQVSSNFGVTGSVSGGARFSSKGDDIDLSEIKGTGYALAALFPVEDIQTTQDAINILLPTGTPEYADAFENKISFDDPVNSLNYLAKDAYPKLKNYVQNNDPETWQRYINLATKSVGISCEFCCGVGPVGISSNGNLRCGCQHNPAAQALALGLMEYTDYSDAEIVREVLRWKTLFFPKNMVSLGLEVAGGDTSTLDELPGMVGGC